MKSPTKRFTAFVRALAKLSMKHGVTIESVGGVTIYDKTLDLVCYDDDHTSGDLNINAARSNRDG